MKNLTNYLKFHGVTVNDTETQYTMLRRVILSTIYPGAEIGKQTVANFLLKEPNISWRLQKALWKHAHCDIELIHYNTHSGIGKKLYEELYKYRNR